MSPHEPALFSPGDIVKLKTGKSPQRIVKIKWDQYQKIWKVFAYYLSSDRENQKTSGNHWKLRYSRCLSAKTPRPTRLRTLPTD